MENVTKAPKISQNDPKKSNFSSKAIYGLQNNSKPNSTDNKGKQKMELSSVEQLGQFFSLHRSSVLISGYICNTK